MNKTIIMAVLAALLLMACVNRAGRTWRELPVGGGNAVYYWRTTLHLDSTETDFIRRHQIRRIYCRYFDVVVGRSDEPVPNATIAFPDAQVLPDSLELIPTVFITENCLRANEADSLPHRIIGRILQMDETNDIRGVKEIQIDCDYTERSRDTFYRLLARMQQLCHSRNLRLSATIRLHQLSMPTPPADYGVLMLYNTGAPERFEERNPILDLRDVAPT